MAVQPPLALACRFELESHFARSHFFLVVAAPAASWLSAVAGSSSTCSDPTQYHFSSSAKWAFPVNKLCRKLKLILNYFLYLIHY